MKERIDENHPWVTDDGKSVVTSLLIITKDPLRSVTMSHKCSLDTAKKCSQSYSEKLNHTGHNLPNMHK